MRTPFKWLAAMLGFLALWAVAVSLRVGAPAPRATPEEWAVARAKAETAVANEEAIRQLEAEPKLELLAWEWGRSSDRYVTGEGMIRNLSGEPLQNVQAMAMFYGKDKGFITSGSALVEYNPLLPGQESPFKVIERWNPAMETARVEFKSRGSQINTKDSRKKQ